MGGTWRVHVLGVRGSAPVHGEAFRQYGGSTSCVAVDCGGAGIILDAGSGLANLHPARAERTDILLSHLHLDHIMGLFTFRALYAPAAEIHLYGAPGVARELTNLIGPPLWPVDLASCQARVRIHEIPPGAAFRPEGGGPAVEITTLEGCHPNGCLYYRLEGGGRSLVYALDCELAGDMASRLTAFARGADMLIWDACFSPEDLRPGWGHATWEQGLQLGREAGVGTVLMTHYNQNYTDAFLREQEQRALRAGRRCRFAREGMVLEL